MIFRWTRKKKDLPFKERPDTAVFSCVHILNGEKPILHVTHDSEGDWQFLCGESHSVSEGAVLSLYEIYMTDNSVGQLADMKCGQSADRNNLKSEWKINPK